jgi:hypothetical protein
VNVEILLNGATYVCMYIHAYIYSYICMITKINIINDGATLAGAGSRT